MNCSLGRRFCVSIAAVAAPMLILSLSISPGAAAADGGIFEIACARDDVDLDSCKTFRNGVATRADPRDVLAALGLGSQFSQRDGWSAGEINGWGPKERFEYLVAFIRPVEAGTVWIGAGELRILKPGAPYPGDPSNADHWTTPKTYPKQTRPCAVTLEPGTRIRSILCSEMRGHGRSSLNVLRLSRARLHNITPMAVANAEAEYTQTSQLSPPRTYAAADITVGWGPWLSHGAKESADRIQRAPLTDVTPSWYILSWDSAKAVRGLVSRDNFLDFKLYTFHGPEGVNPATSLDHEWERRRDISVSSSADGARWISFPPVETRGVKLLITRSQPPRFARIDALGVCVELGDKPLPPPPKPAGQPPFSVRYSLAKAGEFSLVIDDAAGRRMRNLVGRASRTAGKSEEPWDLKTESGSYVLPGTYRWKGVYQPGVQLRHHMTPYPNIVDNSPENSPWLNGHSGPGGWLADHSAPGSVCAYGDRIYFGSGCAESGVAFIECDLTGRKLWGRHNFAAWQGPEHLAVDEDRIYVGAGHDRVWTVGRKTRQTEFFLGTASTSRRKRGIRGLAARDGRLYMSVRADASWLSDAAAGDDVDITRCLPRYPPLKKSNAAVVPDPRSDFLRLFRLQGTPPGNDHGGGFLTWLESTDFASNRNHILLAFKKPVAVGSVAFSFPEEPIKLRLSVLSSGASYPPSVRNEEDWDEFWEGIGKGWTVLPAPENTITRAIRITFDKGTDELDLLMEDDDIGDADMDLPGGDGGPAGGGGWLGRLEGMKILRRRYENLYPKATVRVASGEVNELGEWDAQLDRPLSEAHPGIYALEWAEPQKIRGLAIKEIDGKRTEIDVFEGPPGSRVGIKSPRNWKHVATYTQKLRYYYQPDPERNYLARYIDGYVDFGHEIETRAIRLRVVEQETVKQPDRAGCCGVRKDRGGEKLEPYRCRIYGVAPVRYIGGEAPVDPMIAERVEVYDTTSKQLVDEFHVPCSGRLAFNPAGRLHVISGESVLAVDADGRCSEFITELKRPIALEFDSDGNAYVFDRHPERQNIRVHDSSGKYVRSIGTPGGRKAGPWDPTTFCSWEWVDVAMCIDSKDQLWVVENDFKPKRTSLWTTAGRFKRDFLGNTAYGGGGCLDPHDTSRLFYQNMQFELDWDTGRTKLKRMTWMGDSVAPEVPIRANGRTYLVTRPNFTRQECGVVYLDEGDVVRRVAAAGLANGFGALRTPEIQDSLGDKSLGDMQFMWTDRNGDQNVQLEEVSFSEKRIKGVSYFDSALGLAAGKTYYRVQRFLPSGAPVYVEAEGPSEQAAVKMSDGSFICMAEQNQSSPLRAYAPDGRELWTYMTEGAGGHAYARAKPYHDSQMVALFDFIGVGRTKTPGGLGEFVVTNSNSGTFHVMTSDGILAGRFFRDLRDPKRRDWSMLEHDSALDLADVTVGQEHFSGYFCTAEDGRQFIVAGHNHTSVVEVVGLEDYKRLEGTFEVTAEDLRLANDWERRQQQREVYQRAPVVVCAQTDETISIDGSTDDWKGIPSVELDEDISFKMTHNGRDTVYLCYIVDNHGPMKNTGSDWRRYYKTGAAVDLQLGADPAADERRKSPETGDVRLLMTVVDGRPRAILYRPIDETAPPDAAWETHTMVFRVGFDRVETRRDVKMACRSTLNGYLLEVSVPTAALGLKITPQLRLRMDWGILDGGQDGNQTMRRIYWANKSTSIVADEAAEAMLHPDLWGHVRFMGKAGGDARDSDPERFMRDDDEDEDDLLELEL